MAKTTTSIKQSNPKTETRVDEAPPPVSSDGSIDNPTIFEDTGALIKALGTEAFYPRLKELLLKVAPFEDIIVLNCLPNGPPTSPFMEVEEATPEAYLAFVQGLYLKSPFYKFSQEGGEGFKTLRELISDDFYESTFYYACMSPTRITDEVSYVIQGEDDMAYLVCLGRSNKYEAFTDKEIQNLNTLFPMVEQAVLRHDWLRKMSKVLSDPDHLRDPINLRLDELASDILTNREREIVGYLVRGYSSKACAQALDISPGTERVHRKNIYQKLGVSSQAELLAVVFDYLS